MSVEIKVPMLPESITEAQVATWHKKEGDYCNEGDVIAELETDKVMLEVVATTSGTLENVQASEGDVVGPDTVLASIAEGKAQAPSEKETPKAETPKEEAPKAEAPAPEADKQPKSPQKQPEPAKPEAKADIPASPSVRREMHQNKVKPEDVTPSGRGGRILNTDLGSSGTSRVKMSRMRAKIAERMVEAQHTAAMLTTFNEVNMEPIMTLRAEHQEAFTEKHGVKLGFMSFFVQAVTHALKAFPEVNAAIDGEDILYFKDANIGIAVSTDRGLVVPVLKKAQNMSYAEIETAIKAYAEKARAGKIELSDMMDGTFTITNGGVFGSMLSTPILNMPQSAILGMHAITKRVVVEDDQMVIRPMMYLALTYDHRLIDGQQSVQFLVTLKEMLENPSKILLDS